MKKYLSKIKPFIEKHAVLCLIILFLICVIIYGIVAKKMTIPVFEKSDEDIYVNMARSFFYEGRFEKEYNVLNYNCILYSMIISLAYFFYTPENILFLMRMIGVILMASSIFPTYLLSKNVLGSKTKALLISALVIIIPETISSVYFIQENLSYPLFLWTVYLIYINFKKDKNTKRDIAILALFALMFFTKSYTILFAISYFLMLFIEHIKNKDIKKIKELFLQGVIFTAFILIGYFILYYINDFQKGINHYDTQIMSIFPLDLSKIMYFIYGIFAYLVFSIFSMGVFPILIPLFNMNKYDLVDRKFFKYLIISMFLTAVEVSAIVYIPEEAGRLFPLKVCVRYLALYTIPYIIMFLKIDKKDIKISNWIFVLSIIILGYMIIYFIRASKSISAIDAYMITDFITLDYYTKLDISDVLAVVIVSEMMLIWLLLKRDEIVKTLKSYTVLYAILLILILPINLDIPAQLSSVALKGNIRQKDYVKLANFLKNDYEKVYAYHLDSYFFYGTLQTDYEKCYDLKELDLEGGKVAIIVNKDFARTIEGAEEVDIKTETISLYVGEENSTNIHIVP